MKGAGGRLTALKASGKANLISEDSNHKGSDQTNQTGPPNPSPTSPALPLRDTLSLQSTDSNNAPGTIDIVVSCELMTNSQTAMPVAPGSDMQLVQGSLGEPLLCTIGDDHMFNVLVGQSGTSNSGWAKNSVLQGFPEYSVAVAFDVTQGLDGLITLAFGLQKPNDPAVDVYIAALLSNDLTKIDFKNLRPYSALLQGLDPSFSLDSLRLGSSDDNIRPMLTIEGSLATKHVLYQLNQNDDTTIKEIELPEDVPPGAQNFKQHTTGFFHGSRANYFLYVLDGDTRLIALTLFVKGERSLGNYSPNSSQYPAGYQNLSFNCIATAITRPSGPFISSDLYIGTPNGG